jgi:hypothetical protein
MVLIKFKVRIIGTLSSLYKQPLQLSRLSFPPALCSEHCHRVW